jgi:hypothetical protein
MPELTEHDAELLFAYLDGELSADEVTALERRLTEDDFLRRELASLRQMVTLIHALPEAKAPRNFTLTPAMVAPKTAPPLQVLPAAEPLIAATMAASPAQPALKIASKPAPRRRIAWQSFAAAAAVFVIAIGFIGVVFNTSQPAPPNVAFAPTETIFSNGIISQENIATLERQETVAASDETANTMPLPAATIMPTDADMAEDAARKDPTEMAVAVQPQAAEIQPEAGIMNMPADTETMPDAGGAPDIDGQVPGFSINPDTNMSGFTVATLPPDALYYAQMTTTPLAPEIVPNEHSFAPPVAAQMTFAPDTLAASTEPETSESAMGVPVTSSDSEADGIMTTPSNTIYVPNVRDGFLVLNGIVLLHWLLNRFIWEQP